MVGHVCALVDSQVRVPLISADGGVSGSADQLLGRLEDAVVDLSTSSEKQLFVRVVSSHSAVDLRVGSK